MDSSSKRIRPPLISWLQIMTPTFNKLRTEGGVAPVGAVEAVVGEEAVVLAVAPITQQLTLLPLAPMLRLLRHRFGERLLLSPAFAWEILPLAILFLSLRKTGMAFSIGRWTRTVRTMPLTTMRNLH
jgi:hypothetical protein